MGSAKIIEPHIRATLLRGNIYAVTILRAVLFYIMGSKGKGGYEKALITKIKAYRKQAGIKQFLIFFLFWGQNPDIYI